MQFDTKQNGLETLFFPWQVAILEELFRRKEGNIKRKNWQGREVDDSTSRSIHDFIKTKHEISRASCINFLELLVEEKILERDTESCKGGSRALYTLRFDRHDFEEYITWMICKKLAEAFPKTTFALNFNAPRTPETPNPFRTW